MSRAGRRRSRRSEGRSVGRWRVRRLRSALVASLPAGLACAAPLAEGGGPSSLELRLGRFSAPAATQAGHVELRVDAFGDTCPDFLWPPSFRQRSFLGALPRGGEPVVVELVPNSNTKIAVTHRSSDRRCPAEVWLRPRAGRRYRLVFDTELSRCAILTTGGDGSRPAGDLTPDCESLQPGRRRR